MKNQFSTKLNPFIFTVLLLHFCFWSNSQTFDFAVNPHDDLGRITAEANDTLHTKIYMAGESVHGFTFAKPKIKIPAGRHIQAWLMQNNVKGEIQWVRYIKSEESFINAITTNKEGDVVATGYIYKYGIFPGLKDTFKCETKSCYIFLVSYTAKGELKWIKTFPMWFWGSGTALALDSKQNIILGGHFARELTIENYKLIKRRYKEDSNDKTPFLAKFDKSGNIIWTKQLDSRNYATIGSVKLDSKDNIVVSGNFKGYIGFSEKDSLINDSYWEGNDCYVAKYNPNAEFLWCKHVGGQNQQLYAGIGIDNKDNIYMAGSYDQECEIKTNLKSSSSNKVKSENYVDGFFIFKLDNSGNLKWNHFKHTEKHGVQLYIKNLDVDQNGNCALVGYFNDTLNINNKQIHTLSHHHNYGLLLIYNNEGEITFVDALDAKNGWAIPTNVEYFKNEKLVVFGLGFKEVSFNGKGGKIIKISSKSDARSFSFLSAFNIPKVKTPKSETANADTTDWQYLEEETPDSAIVVCAKELKQTKPASQVKECSLITIFPNPFTDNLNIKFSHFKTSSVNMIIMDEKGSILYTSLITELAAETIKSFDMSDLASGAYFIKIYNSDVRSEFKIIKVKP